MKPIIIPQSYNYIATFCPLPVIFDAVIALIILRKVSFRKSIFLVKIGSRAKQACFQRRPPHFIQGGEPSLQKDFIYILNNIKPELNIDVLTNLQFDEDEFIRRVNPNRIKGNLLMPLSGVSYHPETMQLDPLVKKVLKLQNNGFSIGIWGVMHPTQEAEILRAKEHCTSLGIDFRTKGISWVNIMGRCTVLTVTKGHVIENLPKKYYARQRSLLSGLVVIFIGVTATFMKGGGLSGISWMKILR